MGTTDGALYSVIYWVVFAVCLLSLSLADPDSSLAMPWTGNARGIALVNTNIRGSKFQERLGKRSSLEYFNRVLGSNFALIHWIRKVIFSLHNWLVVIDFDKKLKLLWFIEVIHCASKFFINRLELWNIDFVWNRRRVFMINYIDRKVELVGILVQCLNFLILSCVWFWQFRGAL